MCTRCGPDYSLQAGGRTVEATPSDETCHRGCAPGSQEAENVDEWREGCDLQTVIQQSYGKDMIDAGGLISLSDLIDYCRRMLYCYYLEFRSFSAPRPAVNIDCDCPVAVCDMLEPVITLLVCNMVLSYNMEDA